MLTNKQKINIMNQLVNGFSHSDLFANYSAELHDEIKVLLISRTKIELVIFLATSKPKKFMLSEIRKIFSVQSLTKKLRDLCAKGYIVDHFKDGCTSYQCNKEISIINSNTSINKRGKLYSCKCIVNGEFYDELSSRAYCADCYSQLLKYSNRHNSNWNHVKKRLKERYNISLTSAIYLDMIKQIQNDSNTSYLSKNNHVVDYTNEGVLSRHITVVDDTKVVTVYKNELDKEKSFIVTVTPICHSSNQTLLSNRQITDILIKKQKKQELIKLKGLWVSEGKNGYINRSKNPYECNPLAMSYWDIGYHEQKDISM